MSKTQYFNYLAIDILDKMGVRAPTQADIDFIEDLLLPLSKRYDRYVSNYLSQAA